MAFEKLMRSRELILRINVFRLRDTLDCRISLLFSCRSTDIDIFDDVRDDK